MLHLRRTIVQVLVGNSLERRQGDGWQYVAMRLRMKVKQRKMRTTMWFIWKLDEMCPDTSLGQMPGNWGREIGLRPPENLIIRCDLCSRELPEQTSPVGNTIRLITMNAMRHTRLVSLLARSQRNAISQSRWNSTQPPAPQVSPHASPPSVARNCI